MPTDCGERAKLLARGCRAEAEVLRMVIELDPAQAPPVWREGVTVSTWRDGCGPAVHAVLFEAFAGSREGVLPFNQWLPRLTSDAEFDPALCFLAHSDGELAGVCLCWTSAFVKDLAVRPAFRGRGIGTALLRHSFAELARRGAKRVALKVDAHNPTGAVRLYERVGMRIEQLDEHRSKG
jgi:ribosomal protein S18 acetylase RimI-like enzyme